MNSFTSLFVYAKSKSMIVDFFWTKILGSFFLVIFAPVHNPFSLLLILIVIDFLTGFWKALKFSSVSSYRLRKGLSKIFTYSIAVAVVRIMEMMMGLEGSTATEFLIFYLGFNELISIMENLVLLGVPLPVNFLDILGKQIRIKSIEDLISRTSWVRNDLKDVEDIIAHHIPKVKDPILRKLLRIKMVAWAGAIRTMSRIEIVSPTGGVFWLKVKLVFDGAIGEMQEEWVKAGVPQKTIQSFERWHEARVLEFLQKCKTIAQSSTNTDPNKAQDIILAKKQQICQLLNLGLYQTITDALAMEDGTSEEGRAAIDAAFQKEHEVQ